MSDLTPVLIVSHYFPPLGGAGTQRFARFARWLPHFGYRPIVVTTHESSSSSSVPGNDPCLEDEIGTETVVCRVPLAAPGRLSWREQIKLAARFRTDAEEWVAQALPYALEQAKLHHARAVITTVSPYAVAEIGRTLRRQLDIPWLLDLRDPWALDGWRTYPSIWHARSDRTRMARALRDADVIIANTPEARRAFNKMLGSDGGRVCTIPNGFEPDDFPALPPPQCADDGAFHLVHAGTLHDPRIRRRRNFALLSRRSWRNINRIGRSGRPLYEAIARIRQENPELAGKLHLDLIGRAHPGHQKLAHELGISDLITEHGYLPHHEAVAMLSRADTVFVPLHGVPVADPALIVPGKLYEAIASGRFVLGGLPEGDGARLIRLTRAGAVCDPLDCESLTQELRLLLEAAGKKSTLPGAETSVLSPFTRQSLTARLAATLDAVITQSGAIPVDDPWLEITRMLPSESEKDRKQSAKYPPRVKAA